MEVMSAVASVVFNGRLNSELASYWHEGPLELNFLDVVSGAERRTDRAPASTISILELAESSMGVPMLPVGGTNWGRSSEYRNCGSGDLKCLDSSVRVIRCFQLSTLTCQHLGRNPHSRSFRTLAHGPIVSSVP